MREIVKYVPESMRIPSSNLKLQDAVGHLIKITSKSSSLITLVCFHYSRSLWDRVQGTINGLEQHCHEGCGFEDGNTFIYIYLEKKCQRFYLCLWNFNSSLSLKVHTSNQFSLHPSPLPPGLFTQSDIQSMVSEITKMQEFHHPHVMPLIGVCLDAGPGVSIVMPYMTNGSLLDYMKKERSTLELAEGEDSEKVI